MAQTSRLVVEIDSRDAEQKAADTRKALEALEDAGLRVKPALDTAGKGLDGVGKSATKSTKSIQEERNEIEQLLESINPLTKKLNELERQEAALNKARKSGKIELDTYNEYSTKLKATRDELGRFNESLGKTGVSAKQTAAALRGVPAQFTDIAVSLQGGQAPLTVLLQQGGQLKDMFGGIGPAAKALGGYVLGLVNPFTVAAAAAAGLGIAYYQGSKEADAYRNALINTGNSAGTTAGALSSMASSIGGTVGTTGEAAAALALLAENGKIARGSFEDIATAAVASQEATGRAVSETIAEFAKIADDPVKAAQALNDQYNFLTAAVYNQIVALKAQGKETEAARLLTDTYADAVRSRATQVATNLGSIERAWASISLETRKTIDAVLNVGRIEDSAKKITELTQKVAAAQSAVNADPDDTANRKKLDQSKQELAYLTQQRDTQAAIAAAEGLSAENQRKGIDATAEFNAQLKAGANNAEKRAEAIKVLNKQIADSVKAGAPIADKDIARRIADINEQFKDPAVKKEIQFREDAGVKALDQARQQYAVLMQQASLIEQQGAGTKALGAAAKDLIEWEQQLANIKTKQTLTADQQSLLAKADQITAVKTQSAEQEKLNALKKEELETSAKLLAFQESINNQLDLSQEGLSNQLAGVGMGREAQKRLQDDLKIRQDYQKQLAKLQRDYQNIVNPTSAQADLYDKETQVLEDALGQRLRMQQDYYVALDRAQSDWTNGANAAWQDYVYEAGDIAGQTYDLFDNAFRGMEDSLVDFVTGGKLSFKSLADSIIADIARILIRAKIVTPALNALLGGSGSGGVSGLLGSGGSGGGGLNLQSAWDGISSAYSIGTSGFGQAVSAGWTAGEGFIGGIQGAFKAGAASLSSGVGSLFASSSGTMVNGVYQLGTSAAPATVDLISNTVTNSSTGAVTGTATGATTAAGTGLSAASAVMAGIGGAIQGYLKAGVKGAIAGAGGAVAGAYAGAAIGSVVPVIGTAIGGAIGSVVGGLFGSSLFGGDWVTKDQGFQLGVEGGDLESYAFKYQKKKGGLFSSNKKRTRLSALDPEMQAALDQTYAATLGSVVGLFDSLNVELNDGVLDGLNVAATQISTKDKTAEQIQEEIAKWFTSLGDAAVAEVNKVTGSGLDGFNLEGLTTFVNNLYSVNSSLDMIGVKMVDFSVAGGRVVESLVALSGGIEALNSNITKFYDGFTSDLQKSIDTLAGVRAQFKALGLVLPETREAFADAVKGLDMTSEAERQIFVSMTANAEQAAAAYTILEQRESAYRSAFFTEAENTALAIKNTTTELKAMGVTLPASRSEYRKMVEEAAKSTTDTGKAMYDTLMNAAAAASTVFDELERRLNQGVTDSFSGVQRSITAQQKAATAAYNATNTSLSDMSATASKAVTDLSTVSNSLESALKSLRGTSDDAVKMLRAQAQATLQSALATARSGGSLSGFTGLSDALDTVGNNSTDLYSSMEDFARDQGRTAGVVAELEAINGKQLTSAELTVKALEDQLDTSKEAYELQMAQFDQDLAFAQAQMDAFNGIDTSVKSVEAAIKALNGSLIASLAAKPATGAGSAVENTAANNATVVDTLYQQLFGRTADAGENKYWADRLSSGNLPYAEIVANMTQYASAADKAAMAVKGHATGGYISGPGTGTSDSIMARLSNGEYVMTADSVRMFGTGLLDQMNAGNLPAFAGGGGIRLVGSSTAESSRPASARYGSGAAAAAMSGSGSQQGVIEAILSLGNYLYMITKYSEQTASGIRRQNEMEEAA